MVLGCSVIICVRVLCNHLRFPSTFENAREKFTSFTYLRNFIRYSTDISALTWKRRREGQTVF